MRFIGKRALHGVGNAFLQAGANVQNLLVFDNCSYHTTAIAQEDAKHEMERQQNATLESTPRSMAFGLLSSLASRW